MDDLVVKVGADITGFLSKIDAAKAKVNQLTEEQGQLKAVVNDLNTSLRLNEKELTTATVKLQKLNTTTAQGKLQAAELRKQIALLATNSKTLSTSLTSAKTNLQTTTAQLRQSSVELKKAQTATAGFAGGVKTAFSGLRTLANLIPGLGIGGIFLVAIEGIKAFVEILGDAKSEVNLLQKAQGALNEIMAEAGGSVAGEVTSLKSLIAIARDTSLSYATRTQAINQLNKEYPELHGNLNLENINTDKVTAAVERQINAMIRRAQISGLQQGLDEESAKLAKTRAAGLRGQVSGFENFLNKTAKVLGAPGLFSNASGDVADFTASIKESEKKIEFYAKKLHELNTVSAKEGTLFVPPPEKVGKSTKALETINDVLAQMRASLTVLGKEADFFNIDKSLEKIKLVQSTVTKLFEQFKLATTDPHILKLDFEFGIAERGEIRRELEKIVPKEVAVPIALTLAPSSAVIPVFQNLTKQVLPEVEKFNQQVSSILQSGLENALSGIGESIGTAIAEGGDIGKAIFGNLFQVIATGLKELGKAMIGLGTTKKALEAFHITPGIGTIIAGVAAVALGHLLQSSIPKFAVGGPVQGPGTRTSDSILARLSKGEFIINADSVSKFGPAFFEMLNRGFMPRGMATGGSVGSNSIGGGQLITVQVEGNIKGRDIHISNRRTGIMLGRNG